MTLRDLVPFSSMPKPANHRNRQTHDVGARPSEALDCSTVGILLGFSFSSYSKVCPKQIWMFISLISSLRPSRLSSLYWTGRTINCSRHSLWGDTKLPSRLPALIMPPKRKRSSVATDPVSTNGLPPLNRPILPPDASTQPPPPKRQASRRSKVDTNPDHNADIVDGKTALRASPDADEKGEALDIRKVEPMTPAKANGVKGVKATPKRGDSDSPLSDIEASTPATTSAKKPKKTPTKSSIASKKGLDEIKAFKAKQAAKKAAEIKVKKENEGDEWEKRVDPDGDDEAPAEDIDTLKKEAARSPPVNSDYLPLPWKGRLGYVGTVCLEVNIY